jgi:hypothetical protein
MTKDEKQVYLGDGVYAYFDGFQIWLETLEGNRIAIEPSVMEALAKYAHLVFVERDGRDT